MTHPDEPVVPFGWLAEIEDAPPWIYWRCVANMWLNGSTGLIDNDPAMWRKVWTEIRTDPLERWIYVMQLDELTRFRALPDRVPVWRGVDRPDERDGLAWTLSREIAQGFGARVYAGLVPRDRVLAHFGRNSEDEIVVLPQYVFRLDLAA